MIYYTVVATVSYSGTMTKKTVLLEATGTREARVMFKESVSPSRVIAFIVVRESTEVEIDIWQQLKGIDLSL